MYQIHHVATGKYCTLSTTQMAIVS